MNNDNSDICFHFFFQKREKDMEISWMGKNDEGECAKLSEAEKKDVKR